MGRINKDEVPNFGELFQVALNEDRKAFLMEKWDDEFQRQDALLTDHQRQFLLGLVEYSGENPRQQRYQMRRRIRRRFIDGIRDLAYLRTLDDNSRKGIEEELDSPGLHLRTADLLEFVYQVTENRGIVEDIVETAIYNAETNDPSLGESGVSPGSVSIDIKVEYPPDYEALDERYRERGISGLQPEEIGYLIRDHRIDPEEIQRYYDGKDEVDDSDMFDGVEYPNHPASFSRDHSEQQDADEDDGGD